MINLRKFLDDYGSPAPMILDAEFNRHLEAYVHLGSKSLPLSIRENLSLQLEDYFEKFNTGEVSGVQKFLMVAYSWICDQAFLAVNELRTLSSTPKDFEISQAQGRVLLTVVRDAIVDHIDKYGKKISEPYVAMAWGFGGEDLVEYREIRIKLRFELLKANLGKLIRQKVADFIAQFKAELKQKERERFKNEADNRTVNRLEPMFKEAIESIIGDLESGVMPADQTIKVLNTLITPIAKMKGELSDLSVEVNASNTFYKLMEGIKRTEEAPVIEADFETKLLEEME